MFGLTGTLNYYLCDGFTDMRWGKWLIKLLRYESDAYILYEKRLDRHRFMRPVYDEQQRCYRMSWERFVLLLQGIVRKELLIAS